MISALEKRFRQNPLHRAWKRHNNGSVRHYVLAGYDYPFLACQAEWHHGYDSFTQGIQDEDDSLADAPDLPKCKRCLNTTEYRLHDKSTDHDDQGN